MSARRRNLTILPLAMLLALTGCAGAADEAGDTATASPAPTSESTSPMPTAPAEAAAAPITAQPTAPNPSTAPSQADNEIEFIAYTAPFLADQGYNLADEQVLGAGLYACELIAQGGNPEVITVVEGSPEYVSEQVAVNAVSMLCPAD